MPPSPRSELDADDPAASSIVAAVLRRAHPARSRVEARQLVLADRHDRHAARLEVLERRRARRGSPSARRRRRPSASGPAPPGPRRCRGSAAVHRPASAPRWTPPIPPVANTRIPAACAAIIVAETVVAAHPLARRAPRRGWGARPSGRSPPAPSRAPRGPRPSSPTSSLPVADRHGRRDRAALADRRLGRAGDLQVLGIRKPVADQRRLEGDDRRPGRHGSRGPPAPTDEPILDHRLSSRPGFASWRAAARCAARTARRRPAGRDRVAAGGSSQVTRKPASKASPAPVVSVASIAARRHVERRAAPRRPGPAPSPRPRPA